MQSLFKFCFYPVISILFIAYWFLKCDEVLKLSWGKAFLLAFLHEVACAICAIAMSFVEAGFRVENATTYRLYGLMFFMPFFYLIPMRVLKIEKRKAFDVCALALVIRLIIGRTNCIRQGCCEGILFLGNEAIRWPIREMEIFYYIVILLLYANKVLKGKTYGQIYPIYLFSYGCFRFCVEWLREEYVGQIWIFHLAHIWSLLAICASVVMAKLIGIPNNNVAKRERYLSKMLDTTHKGR